MTSEIPNFFAPHLASLLANLRIPLQDPRFFSKAFTLLSKERKSAQAKEADNFKRIFAEEYDELSRRLDRTKIQESCSVRNVLMTRRLANLLINDQGELLLALLPRVIQHLSGQLYALGPQRRYDSVRREHILKVLIQLKDNKKLVHLLKNISKPYSHPHADQIIRDTLQLPDKTILTDAHARRAALSAWFCYLRQNVGSCFATAPAIIVHDEQPELFLTDLNELLGTGRLKRTFAGVEYSVPLSASWGAGDLKKLFFLPNIYFFEQTEIWLSPGLINALEVTEILALDAHAPLKMKIARVKELLLKLVQEVEDNKKNYPHQPYSLMSAEDIIRRVLMRHYSINEQDLEFFDARQRVMMGSQMLLLPHAMHGSTKSEACTHFYTAFERAKSAFRALADNALLKSWEFSLASFAETKAEFTRWNLYSSLGLGPQESEGIGFCLYAIIKDKLDQCNMRLQGFQVEYEQVYTQIQYLESRIRHAGSEQEANWTKLEYQAKMGEFQTIEDLRNKAHAQAQCYAGVFDILINAYDSLFPHYFQEVYDADMHEVKSGGPYDDSPAGFRLLYKHGRSNTSQWTLIKNADEFVDALVSFFIASESEIVSAVGVPEMQSDVSEFVTAIVNHVKTKAFLESAFHRMAAAHKTAPIRDPLEHLDLIEKKPWAYTSGGTMGTLVSCYYRREQKPTEISRWVENPVELLVFLVDGLRQVPYKKMEEFILNPSKSMLMYSPTHAFLLKPGLSPFKDAWTTDEYTYTWVRDRLITPMSRFVDDLHLDEDGMEFLIQVLTEYIPPDFQHYFRKIFSNIHGAMSSTEFREYILEQISHERGLKVHGRSVLSADDIDGTLFSLLPLFRGRELKERLEALLAQLPGVTIELNADLLHFLNASGEVGYNQIMTAQTLQDICQALLCLASGQTSAPYNYHKEISLAAQKLGYAMPVPVIFSDTNWVKDVFGFVVNPGTGRCELWRLDYTGRVGAPMSSWSHWLNGSRKDIPWGVYIRSYEYSS